MAPINKGKLLEDLYRKTLCIIPSKAPFEKINGKKLKRKIIGGTKEYTSLFFVGNPFFNNMNNIKIAKICFVMIDNDMNSMNNKSFFENFFSSLKYRILMKAKNIAILSN